MISAPLHPRLRRLRNEWLALCAALLLAATLVIWSLDRDHRAIEAQESDRLEVQARLVDERLSRELEGVDQALRGIGAELRRVDGAADAAPVSAKLTLVAHAIPGIHSMMLINANGAVVAANRGELLGQNARTLEYFEVPMQGLDPSVLYTSSPIRSTLNTHLIVVSRVLLTPGGEFAGVLAATLDPKDIDAALNSVLFAPDMRAALVHQDGRVYAATPGADDAVGSDLSKTDSVVNPFRRRQLSASLAIGRVTTGDKYRIVVMRSVGQGPLRLSKPIVVAVSRELAVVYAPWRERALELALLLLGGAAAAASLLFGSQRRRLTAESIAASESALQRSGDERVELALRSADLGLWELHVPSDRFSVNARERALLGLDDGDEFPQSAAWRFLIHPEDRAAAEAAMHSHLQGLSSACESEYRMLRKDGRWIWLQARALVVERDANGAPLRIAGTHLDLTERKAEQRRLALASTHLRASREQLSLALDGAGLAPFDWDLANGTIFHSAQAAAMRGASDAAPQTLPIAELQALIHPADLATVHGALQAATNGSAPTYLAEFRMRKLGADWLWVRAHGRVVERDAQGRALRLAGTYADIDARKLADARLRRLAEYDPLTNLPNRALFRDRLQQAVARAARGTPLALLCLDLDGFEAINDALGHEVGDRLLKLLATRMQLAVRRGDTVARLAADEFAVILDGIGSVEQARRLADKLARALREPASIDAHEIEVTASIGIALGTGHSADESALLRRGLDALQEAKRRGGDVCVCDAGTPELERAKPARATAA